MHNDRSLVEKRLSRVLSERVLPAVYTDRAPLELQVWHVPGEPVPVAEALAARYQPFAVGDAWGPPWSTSWFRVTGTIPGSWAGRRVEALFDLGFGGDWPGFQAEGLAYDANGVPVKGIEPQNRYVPIAAPADGGEPVHLLIEAAANPEILANGFRPTPLGDRLTAGDAPLYRFRAAELAVLDEPTWQLGLDMQVLRELMAELGTDDPRRHEILRALERALDVLDGGPLPDVAPLARAELAEMLARPAHASAHVLSGVGHAHIDSAWLWPQRETVRKASRTFANVTALAAEYPELVFACSQAQQYAWVKQRSPEIFERIRAAVKAGQWAPVGGMWVEADGNLPSGEALARQLVHGKRFFLEEFGIETRGVWLPDSFGYTAAFPQLTRLAGMHWFLTQKLSWNDTNAFPHHTFWWEGIDGSRVFTHFPPIDTYSATLRGDEVARAVRNFADKGAAGRSLAPFGHGDGGGGPTREMLERARRLRDLEGSARVVIETPDAFFAAAEAEYPEAPVWSGELYLELHRGTFTTQARTKAGNRRSEHLLREAELWAATAAVRTGADYPADALDRLWKVVLLHQFHDILPGSSIAWVHREAEATYRQLHAELESLIGAAAARLGSGAAAPLVLNAGPRRRREVALIPAGPTVPAGSTASRPGQPLADGAVAVLVDVPGLAAVPLDVALAAATAPDVAPVTVEDRPGGGVVLGNGLVRVELDGDGLLSSVRDLGAGGREVLAPGTRGNLLQLHPDRPAQWDAWDVERHYRHRRTDLTTADAVEVEDAGALLATVRVRRSFGASTLSQTVSLRAGSPRIDVHTEVDWQERNAIMKAAFPLDVHADRSTAEIQFGHVHRPTHTNTGWDAARFEVYAHRWVHVGEAGYGVGLLTDSTYGYDAGRHTRDDGGTTTTVRLSLLRAPQSPDPQADRGLHRFGYALLPGAGIDATIAEAYAFTLPLRTVLPSDSAEPVDPRPLVTLVDVGERPASATVEAVKLADDGSGDVVVRLYESLGGRATARLVPGFAATSAVVTDLLERPLDGARPAAVEDGVVELGLRPFQVVTVRLAR
ncbi:MAG TPA: glycoside hydrolase family 38 C-terminal domain-containing protein [Kineosporiaceae bacterium]